MVDAMANSWTGNLGIDGYTEDCSSNYPCMLQTSKGGALADWASIVGRVRATQPQLVMSGEGYGSWQEMMIADANIGGQGSAQYAQSKIISIAFPFFKMAQNWIRDVFFAIGSQHLSNPYFILQIPYRNAEGGV